MMHRVYFDTNDAIDPRNDLYWLGLNQSKLDLEAMGDDLKEGTRVVIYMTNELEMEAVLEFIGRRGWAARGEPSTIKYLDGSA
jgi:hypothetical protein